MSEDEFSLPLLPYYVYELRDPRNGEVFYVGKGTGQRMLAHSDEEDSAKGWRLKQIRDAGYSEIRVVVGRFETEGEAFAVESTLIKWVYGFGNLTNVVHGHRHAFIRASDEKTYDAFQVLPNIDIPRKLSVNDGSYTEEQRRRIAQHGILEKLEAIRSDLIRRPELAGLQISEPDISVPQDPTLSISGFSDSTNLTLKVQLTGKTVVLALNPKGRLHVEAFDREITAIRIPFEKKNGGAHGYARIHDYKTRAGGFPKGIPIERTDIVALHIANALDRLADRHPIGSDSKGLPNLEGSNSPVSARPSASRPAEWQHG